MYPLLPGHVRNEQFCTADTAVRKVFSHPPTLTLLYILVWPRRTVSRFLMFYGNRGVAADPVPFVLVS